MTPTTPSRSLPALTIPLTLLREQLEQANINVTTGELPTPAETPAPAAPGVQPFSGQAPVLVSQNNEPVDQASAQQLAAAPAGGVVPCMILHLSTDDAVQLLSRLQDYHSFEHQLQQGDPLLPGDPLVAGGHVEADLGSAPTTLVLHSRFEAEDAARRGELTCVRELNYHRYRFTVDFENLLQVPEHLLHPEQTPYACLFGIWNPGADLNVAARNASLNREDYLRQAIRRQAYQRGYDGIKFGNDWVVLIN